MKKIIAVVIVKGKKLLIARRVIADEIESLWEFPSGKIESDETDQKCIMREINKALNIEISVEAYLGELTYKTKEDEINLVLYKAKCITNDIINDHDKIEWVTIDELKDFKFVSEQTYFKETLIPNKISVLGFTDGMNIFNIWDELNKETPFAARRSHWVKKNYVIVDEVISDGKGYGIAYGYSVINKNYSTRTKIPNPGVYSWEYVEGVSLNKIVEDN